MSPDPPAAAEKPLAPGRVALDPALAGILLHQSLILRKPITRGLVEKVVDQIILPAATGRPHLPQGTA
jgi:hypothetical protein